MKATTNRHRPHPAYRAGSVLVGVLLLFYVLLAPGGDHWFDGNGSVCQAAEVNRCPAANGATDAPAIPAYKAACADFVADDGCTDCYAVSSSIRPAQSDTAFAFPAETVCLPKPFTTVSAATARATANLGDARPPPNGFQPPPLPVRCSRPPPVP